MLSDQVLSITVRLIATDKLMAWHPTYFPLAPTTMALRTPTKPKKKKMWDSCPWLSTCRRGRRPDIFP